MQVPVHVVVKSGIISTLVQIAAQSKHQAEIIQATTIIKYILEQQRAELIDAILKNDGFELIYSLYSSQSRQNQ